ncbi:Cysteine-rich receptor-like protein kinase, partial [Thalictrum thalictroides]
MFVLLSLLLLHTGVQAEDPIIQQCSNTTNYTSNSQFETNLNLLLSSLLSNGTRDGFFNTSIGTAPDTVYGLVSCRDKDMEEMRSAESLEYNFREVRDATDNFSDANKLGKGGFGIVYKGLLSDGRKIAVKRLSSNFGQGVVELKNEVLLVVKLQHRNLVKLLGFCLEGDEKLLIYEFAENKSLDNYIF